MEKAEAKAIIAAEGLSAGVWFSKPDGLENRVAIYEVPEGFRVCVTSERGAEEGIREFDSESAALDKYVRLLRVQQRLLDRGVI